ncbi:MAG: hypothetical protein K2W96_24750 [Gemmataceae bacterium]|nr:hypothetical protein [Gemmataceae bacterium]
MKLSMKAGVLLAVLPALLLLALGCGKPEETGKDGGKDGSKLAKKKDGKEEKDGQEEPKHEGWWCGEHGIPEKECIMCDTKRRAEAKKNGDWCEHKRVKSQCFACDPKLKEFYAAKYRAKFAGKEPPPAEENK